MMADTTLDEWVNFLRDAGIRDNIALQYASSFFQNRIQLSMVLDLNRDVLRELGVLAIGDAIAILKHAKAYHEQSTHMKILKSVSSENKDKKLPGFDNRILPAMDTTSISLNIRSNEGAGTSCNFSPVKSHFHSNAAIRPGNNFTMIKEDLSDMRQEAEDQLPSTLLSHDRISENYNSAAVRRTNTIPSSIRLGYLPREEPPPASPPEMSFKSVQNRDTAGHSYGTHLVARSPSNQSSLSEISTKQENTSLEHISTTSNISTQSLGIKIPVQQQSYLSNVSPPQQFSVRAMKRTHSGETDTQSSNYQLKRRAAEDTSPEILQRAKRFAISQHGFSQEQGEKNINVYAPSLSVYSGKHCSAKSGDPKAHQSNQQYMNPIFDTNDNTSVCPDDLENCLITADRQSLSKRRLQVQTMSLMQEQQVIPTSNSRPQAAQSCAQQVIPTSNSRPQAAQSCAQQLSSSVKGHNSTLLHALALEGAQPQRNTQKVQSQIQGASSESNRSANITVNVNGSGIRKIKKNTIRLKQTQPQTMFYSPENKTQAGGTSHQKVTMPSSDYHSIVMSNNGLKTKLYNNRFEMLEEVADTSSQKNGSSTDWGEFHDHIAATPDSTCGSDSGDVPSQINDVSRGLQLEGGNNSLSNRVPGQIFSRLGMKIESPSPSRYMNKIAVKNNALSGSTNQRVVKVNPKKIKTKQAQNNVPLTGKKLIRKAVAKKKIFRIASQKASSLNTHSIATDGASKMIFSGPQKKLQPRGILKPNTSNSESPPQRMTANLLLESVTMSEPENTDTASEFLDEDLFGSYPSETEEESYNQQAADGNISNTDGELSEIHANSANSSKNVRFGAVSVKEFQKNVPPLSSPGNYQSPSFRKFRGRQKQMLS